MRHPAAIGLALHRLATLSSSRLWHPHSPMASSWVAAVWLSLLALLPSQAQPLTLVPRQSNWSYFAGSREPSPTSLTAWRQLDFNDASWTPFPAPVGYGEPGIIGANGTTLTGMQGSHTTFYLRRHFTVTDPALCDSLILTAICDDGFRAWINGQPVATLNAPAGTPLFTARATANIPEPVRYTDYTIANPAQLLRPGDNVLAVQVFNADLTSSDIVFDAELNATFLPVGPPSVAQVIPAPGPVSQLSAITVTFNEPVQGIRAEDFLVNGASANGVTGSGATYTFTFATPAFGEVVISWGALHNIQDFENPPQRFELTAPGSAWTYDLLDPNGPSLIARQPPSASIVSALTQVEVRFNKAVSGLDASDLLLNGIPARQVSGFGAGPFLFEFSPASAGTAVVSWNPQHSIVSEALEPHPFTGGSWSYTVQPTHQTPALHLTEIMAENFTAYRDEDRDPEDWIEIHNPTPQPVSLEGWALSNSASDPSQWIFPNVILAPNAYLVVFASGKDRRPAQPGPPLHTNFKLNANGDSLTLYGPELPRQAISQIDYPLQGPDHSYGRENNTGDWRYFPRGTPGSPNGISPIVSVVEPVRFSVPRGFFARAFQLTLSCPTPGATIRYTTNGSPPTADTGLLYSQPIPIPGNRVVRAAAFLPQYLPSRITTHTYLVGLPTTRLRLPALSLVTATNHLYGPSGIMEVSPRNTTKRGPAWERPVSVEYIRVEDNGGFQTDAGLRLQGGDYVRGQYNYRNSSLPFSKYSFRLYFRGEYGQGRLEYPLFPETTQRSFDTVVLRAGMNDHSNPFLLDEFVRTLARDCAQPSAVGSFVHLFLNGVYRGYYNPCERIDIDFLRAYHGGGESWDVMAQNGEVREGNATAWNSLRTFASTRNLRLPENYLDLASRLDLTNFVDYLCPLIYVDNDDWPHNNWRAARERIPGAPFRFYVWDAEWSFGVVNGHAPSFNTIQNQLSSTSPPWGSTEIQRLFNALRPIPEFRLLFADRVHRHFFNDGALTDHRIRSRYAAVTNRLNGVVPGFNNRIGTTWIPQRRRHVLLHLDRAGFLASSNAPTLSIPSGPVPLDQALELTALNGSIFYTTNGSDPRLPFTGEIHPDALTYATPLILRDSLLLQARTLHGTNWSAITTAQFQVQEPLAPIEFSEIMYHPPDGEAFEFLELVHRGSLPLDLSGWSFSGVNFRFPEPSPLFLPGSHWILANDAQPEAFNARYPNTTVQGWFSGNLSNSGERLDLRDRSGNLAASVHFSDLPPWPTPPDGSGPSLERIDFSTHASDPAAWIASPTPGGTPGTSPSSSSLPDLRLSEIVSFNDSGPDWVELHNAGPTTASLHGWSLSDSSDPRRFVFPANTSIPPNTHLRIWCADAPPATGGLATGFALSQFGETLALYQPSGSRHDAVTFGRIPHPWSLARLGSNHSWHLAEPTPGGPNEPAALAPDSAMVINEWLNRPAPGSPPWIEFHNTHPSLPASLHDVTVAADTSSSSLQARIGIPHFIAPSGFALLHTDDTLAPDHLDLTLPTQAGSLSLWNSAGQLLHQVQFSNPTESVSWGLLPDGSTSILALPHSASPGASNYLASALPTPQFHEWMALNRSAVPGPHGDFPDWIELHNPTTQTLSLGGAILERSGTPTTHRWTLPAGLTLAPDARRLIWCDANRPASTQLETHLQFGANLPADGATLRLLNPSGQVWDSVRYGFQLPDLSVGRTTSSLSLLSQPTPGAPNSAPSTLGDPLLVRINEWLASASDGPDWLELSNPQSLPVNLGGHYLTDDPSIAGTTQFEIQPLTFLAPHGHALWFASGTPEIGPTHLNFRLALDGETLRLYSPHRSLINAVDFGPQQPDVSQGRFPEGADAFAFFPDSPSPDSANWLPHPQVVISEILAHTAPPLEAAIEIHNDSGLTLPLSGWWLSPHRHHLHQHQLKPGLILLPGAYHVAYEHEFNDPNSSHPFTLRSDTGGELWLSEVDPQGQLTGYRAHATFDPAPLGVSIGRHPLSFGFDFSPLYERTFGRDQPADLTEFRQGTGLPNAEPAVGPVGFSEIHYRPSHGPAQPPEEIPDFEFVELYNSLRSPVPLHDPDHPTLTWRLRGGIQFDFPPHTTLPGGGFLVVTRFSPTNTALLNAFRQRYPLPESAAVFGPFTGRLANDGDTLRLERPLSQGRDPASAGPGRPLSTSAPHTLPTPTYALVERLTYRSTGWWPAEPLAHDVSLHRRPSHLHANDPVHWFAHTPTPGRGFAPPPDDLDFDGMPDAWERTHNLNPNDPGDAHQDLDLDGLSNLEEYIAGTLPRDPFSNLKLTLPTLPDGTPVLRFTAQAGKTYTLLQRADPRHGSWTPSTTIPAQPQTTLIDIPLTHDAPHPLFFRLLTPALDSSR